MPSLFRLRVLKAFLPCVRISYDDKAATHPTPRRTVFTQRLVSGYLYEVNVHFLITVLVDQKIKIPAWYCLEDEVVMFFDSHFTFESKLGWHRLFLTVESTREIRTLVVYLNCWKKWSHGDVGIVGLTKNFKFCPLNWKWISFECFRMYFWGF